MPNILCPAGDASIIEKIAIFARLFEQILLQYSEGFRKLDQLRNVAKSVWFGNPPILNGAPQ
ncbi:hypothetical protein RMR21_001550 [Agrobacterium sp. rho-8.1]